MHCPRSVAAVFSCLVLLAFLLLVCQILWSSSSAPVTHWAGSFYWSVHSRSTGNRSVGNGGRENAGVSSREGLHRVELPSSTAAVNASGSQESECESPGWERASASGLRLEGPGLPGDTTYMLRKTCSQQRPPQGSINGSDSSSNIKIIVNLNRQEYFYPDDPHYRRAFEGCVYNACRFTDDRSMLPRADAVFVAVSRIKESHPPPRASPSQVWIAFTPESPVNLQGHHESPQWRRDLFNRTMTYRTDADVFSPYAFLALRSPHGHGTGRSSSSSSSSSSAPEKNYTDVALRKTRAVAWFVSHCDSQSGRDQYVQQLQRHIPVDVYGKCSGKSCGKDEGECKSLLSSTYYFYLSFENSLCRDYVTEKFFKIFNGVDVVPVVRGTANYSRYFPPGTFLDAASFPSPRHLADHLKSLMAGPAGDYAGLLRAKDRFRQNPQGPGSYYRNTCRLCEGLHTWGHQTKVIPDLMTWIKDGVCHNPVDV